MTELNIMILDDHELILRGLQDLLKNQPGFQVVGSYTSSKQLLAQIKIQNADVIVMDYALAPDDMDGLGLIKLLHGRYPNTAILVVSAHYNSAIVSQALRGGARGFIGKNLRPETICKAIIYVAKGKTFLEAEMETELMMLKNDSTSTRTLTQTTSYSVELLSPKELEVIRCFVEGMTVSDIADKFNRSLKTISGQKQSALRKLGLKSDHELFLIRDEIL